MLYYINSCLVLGLDLMRDVLGAWLSFLCILHCALPLLLVAFGTSIGLNHLAESAHQEWLHSVLLMPVIGILAFSLPKAYRVHRNPQPVFLAVVGTLSLIAGILIGGHWESFLTVMGSMLIIYSHLMNRKTLKLKFA